MADASNRGEGGSDGQWRSLGELTNREGMDGARAREFMEGVTEEFDLTAMAPMSRKRFLALLSASAAFAAAGCTAYRDKGAIVPYTRKPEEITPGVANAYASTCTGCSQQCGILIKTREGRPIKVDGNPDHPVNRGKICATGQASILNLYDPQRLRQPAFGSLSGRTGELTWDQADRDVRGALETAVRDAREIAIVAPPISSPSARRTLDLFAQRFPTTRLYSYELFNDENRRTAWRDLYGTADLPSIAWERASIILALESDFLGPEGTSVENIGRFASRRDAVNGNGLTRLYCVEGAMSLTGANADYRLRLRPDLQLGFVYALLHEIIARVSSERLHGETEQMLKGHSLEAFGIANGLTTEVLTHLVDDLVAQKGKAIVHAGPTLPVAVHAAVHLLNDLLGNDALYDFELAHRAPSPLTPVEEFERLIERMKGGSVAVVIHLRTNPVFHLPRTLGYQDALGKVPTSISLVEFDDETSQHCSYILPAHHAFESWGDYAGRVTVVSFQQPVIAPLYATRQPEAVLLYWSSNETAFRESFYHEFMMGLWEKDRYPAMKRAVEFRTFWFSALHDGVIRTDEQAETPRAPRAPRLAQIPAEGPPEPFTVILRQNHFIGDGHFANNGWLQELPHPISKVTWDNYAAMSPATAGRLAVESEDVVRVALRHGAQDLPIFVQPGMADNLIAVELGYGRWNGGTVGTGVGADAILLLPAAGLTGERIMTGASVSTTGAHYRLATTQEHHALDDTLLSDLHHKRGIIRDGTVAEYQRDNEFLHRSEEKPESITSDVQYRGVKWAMAIDLNKCVGCNACVAGCNVENNIAVVGKDQVERGREMQWIRIDRYYAGTPEDPQLSHQPMLCQQCDNAPCENVCPVAATNHSPDGLNQMVYNRCVGTKYCSNNCPYKVRRFNFFNFRDNYADGYYLQEPVSLVHNPEVTVRSRGVMEKCTFCIQRIAEARQHAAEQGRPLSGNDVKTACQEACPAEAIVFGDMNDPASLVSAYRKHPLGYTVLEEVNARPNVTYMARLRNIHPEKKA